MKISFKELTTPDSEIARTFEAWSNDRQLAHLIRPNQNQQELEKHFSVNLDSLTKQLEQHPIYLIYLDGQLVGEMNFQIDPDHLYTKVPETAWIGIIIGEKSARGKGVGFLAMEYMEKQIQERRLKRIELGVFEFNIHAINLYKKMGYQEIGRIDNFTYWRNRMWQDIRMEKYMEL